MNLSAGKNIHHCGVLKRFTIEWIKWIVFLNLFPWPMAPFGTTIVSTWMRGRFWSVNHNKPDANRSAPSSHTLCTYKTHDKFVYLLLSMHVRHTDCDACECVCMFKPRFECAYSCLAWLHAYVKSISCGVFYAHTHAVLRSTKIKHQRSPYNWFSLLFHSVPSTCDHHHRSLCVRFPVWVRVIYYQIRGRHDCTAVNYRNLVSFNFKKLKKFIHSSVWFGRAISDIGIRIASVISVVWISIGISQKTMTSNWRFTAHSLLLLVAVLHVRDTIGAKCTFSFTSGTAVCNNVNSFREIVREIRLTWVNLKINNRLGGSFAMVLHGMNVTWRRRRKKWKHLRSSRHYVWRK